MFLHQNVQLSLLSLDQLLFPLNNLFSLFSFLAGYLNTLVIYTKKHESCIISPLWVIRTRYDYGKSGLMGVRGFLKFIIVRFVEGLRLFGLKVFKVFGINIF